MPTKRIALVVALAAFLVGCGSDAAPTGRSDVDPAAAASDVTSVTDSMLVLMSDATLCAADDACARVMALDTPAALEHAGSLEITAGYLAAHDADQACASAASSLRDWATLFPSAIAAWSRDVKAGELADGFELFRSQADKWPALSTVLLACT